MARRLVQLTVGLAVLTLIPGTAAMALTPNPNSAVFNLRVFNDCPGSTVTTFDTYPSDLWIEDLGNNCTGVFANLHNWRFSEDDVNAAVFNNNSNFRIKTDLVISGLGEAESGFQIAPWWSQSDGRLNVRTTDGEIACFGGRLPFFTFTGVYGLRYVKGDVITLEIIYLAHDLTELNPATIEYKVTYGGTEYSSGVLPFDEGNPNEPYGTWGILDDARVGAHMQVFWEGHANDAVKAEWTNIEFENLDPIAVEPTSWGRVKSLYR